MVVPRYRDDELEELGWGGEDLSYVVHYLCISHIVYAREKKEN